MSVPALPPDEFCVEGIACPILLASCQAVDEAIAAGQLQLSVAMRAKLFAAFGRTGRPVLLVPPRRVSAVVEAALDVAHRFGAIQGEHHKTWVIDQMVRALTGNAYQAWVATQKAGEDGPETYTWEEGIAP